MNNSTISCGVDSGFLGFTAAGVLPVMVRLPIRVHVRDHRTSGFVLCFRIRIMRSPGGMSENGGSPGGLWSIEGFPHAGHGFLLGARSMHRIKGVSRIGSKQRSKCS
jgi:hypothetical protein